MLLPALAESPRMYRMVAIPFLAAALCLVTPGMSRPQTGGHGFDAPLPNATELLRRSIANERKLAAEQERYECRATNVTTETDSNGKVKKTTTVVRDQFFVNGLPIERILQKDGKDLSAEDQHKQDERVMKETVKYSNEATAKKEMDKQNQQLEDFLEAMMLTNGYREAVNGRSVLFYDIVPNPRFQAKNLNQRLAQVLQGKVSIDEETGEMIDVNVKSVADLKIGGGLLANVHKGLWVHVHDHAQADGVWLTDLAEGSGDARAALFLHPYFRFKETTDNCHLYTATAEQVGPAQPVKRP